ncbi:SDR family oxidoreductase [Frondihabitans cladoniiphilus]|uniref:SDR family oxidoreductase n=1 Tax=Frondihabitans cladoniiphilus TaxID=715785 RepID=A0ABP8WAF2_9MICO
MQNETTAAIVTGGSRGIGQAIAIALGGEGFGVAVAYSGSVTGAADTVDRIVTAGGRAIAVQADVADAEAVERLFTAAEEAFGTIQVVAHAAGTSSLTTLSELDLGELDAVLRTNVRGTLVVDQQAARRVGPGGAIVNIASSATRMQAAGNIAYIASKGAVEAITLAFARELAGRDITVNAVSPGPILTDMLGSYLAGPGGETVRGDLESRSPLGRIGEPRDIAEIVTFLTTAGRWINGQVIHANGGIA